MAWKPQYAHWEEKSVGGSQLSLSGRCTASLATNSPLLKEQLGSEVSHGSPSLAPNVADVPRQVWWLTFASIVLNWSYEANVG